MKMNNSKHNSFSSDATINDFGAQWTRLTENTGYYASIELLGDLLEPLVPLESLKGARVAEVGSGTGRIVNMLLDAGVQHVTALEPSAAMGVLRDNTKTRSERIDYVIATGDRLPVDPPFDFVFSIGVIHHIPDPLPVLRRMYASLKPGGTAFIWVYGHEGNEIYLRIFGPVRRVTPKIPDGILRFATHLLAACLWAYIRLCAVFPLPMRGYMRGLLAKYKYKNLFLTVFDQLNPTHAVYYRREEALALMADAGLENVRIHHRHGYSWSVAGTKPVAPDR